MQQKKLSDLDLVKLGIEYRDFNLDPHTIYAVLMAESSHLGGFGGGNGRLTIQFEPRQFIKYYRQRHGKAPRNTGTWNNNKVDVQSKEWRAFNDAWKIDPIVTMLATSIGMMQVMGFNYERCGFVDVGEMFDYAKESEKNQLDLGLRYIIADPDLVKACNEQDWHTFARLYNGPLYHQGGYHTKLARYYTEAQQKLDISKLEALAIEEMERENAEKEAKELTIWQHIWKFITGDWT